MFISTRSHINQNEIPNLYSDNSWFQLVSFSFHVGLNMTFSLMENEFRKRALVYRVNEESTMFSIPTRGCWGWCPHWLSAECLSLLFLPHPAQAWQLFHITFTSKVDDSLLSPNFDIVIWRRTKLGLLLYTIDRKVIWELPKNVLSVIQGFKLLFSHPSPSIKSSEFAPRCCQADDECPKTCLLRENIDTVWSKSGSRFNKEYARRNWTRSLPNAAEEGFLLGL